MRPAAHPQMEFTTTIVVPGRFFKALSTSSVVSSSSIPRRVSSSRIGTTIISGYIGIFKFLSDRYRSILSDRDGEDVTRGSFPVHERFIPRTSSPLARPLCILNRPHAASGNVALAPLTTFQLGGPARFFAEAKSRPDVEQAVAFARRKNCLLLLGGGSNLVVSDSGSPGLVLKVAIGGIEQLSGEVEGRFLFDVGAGESWDNFVFARRRC